MRIKLAHSFTKGISPKVNIITQQKFERNSRLPFSSLTVFIDRPTKRASIAPGLFKAGRGAWL